MDAKPTAEACLSDLIKMLQFPSELCLPVLFSYAMGWAIVLGSPLAKVPQILNVVKSKSADGIRIDMFVLEVLVYSISWAYSAGMGMTFREYGEAAILNVMTCILVALLLIYSPSGVTAPHIALAIAYAVLLYLSLTGVMPLAVLRAGFSASVLFNITGRVPQILQNFRSSSTGQLSLVTFLLNAGASGVRVLTSLLQLINAGTLDKDLLFVLGNYVLSAAMNGVIFLQIVYYNYVAKDPATKKKSQ
eukprot:TRINITY_DN79695_c0_g1_i1.p1 TRINITY_DN79695_c0_g1~~TRINITY_DN79695_c0_g1_i1.p1  ORF type:complete len:258 (+),score=45.20 TRINITY_DN79695_c0_g1_i1:34-774(+)